LKIRLFGTYNLQGTTDLHTHVLNVRHLEVVDYLNLNLVGDMN